MYRPTEQRAWKWTLIYVVRRSLTRLSKRFSEERAVLWHWENYHLVLGKLNIHMQRMRWNFIPYTKINPSGCPVSKTLCLHCRGQGPVPGRGARILHASWNRPKKTNSKQTRDFKLRPRLLPCLSCIPLEKASVGVRLPRIQLLVMVPTPRG